LIRIYPDDTWDLVVGDARQTPQGYKAPLSGLGPGFDNFFNGYFWRMVDHQGCLYLGTFDWSVFLPYADKTRMLPQLKRYIQNVGAGNIAGSQGGFDLWRTRDGVRWIPVTTTGLNNPYNYGARTMVSTPIGLLVGTANPFGPEVAVRQLSRWMYVPNPRGGAEVWRGVQTGDR
jgi:hypothetical protein